MKQFLKTLLGVILDILDFLAVLFGFLWNQLKRFVLWFVPVAKAAGASAQQRLKKEWEDLPEQIEWAKKTAREKTLEFQENLPEHKRKMKAMAQDGMETLAEMSLRTKNAFYRGTEAIHRNVERFKESIDDVPETQDFSVEDVASPKNEPSVKEEPLVEIANVTAPRSFHFQKRHLWVIIVICVIVAGVSSMRNKKSGTSTQNAEYSSSNNNSSSASGTNNSAASSSNYIDNSVAMEILNQQKEDAEKLRDATIQAASEREAQKKAEKEQQALIEEHERQQKNEQQKRQAERLKGMSGFGLN